jgi:hypothetical protein
MKERETEFLVSDIPRAPVRPLLHQDFDPRGRPCTVNETVFDNLDFSQINIERRVVISPSIVFSVTPLTCNSRTKATLESRSSNDPISFHSAI